tara:strand:+ start:1117 stop:2037 length:921 start_codon:yes stop_codon:yes gene_type:complete
MSRKIKFVTQTLGDENRNRWVQKNKKTLSNLTIWKAIDGNDYEETLKNFIRIDVPYQTLLPYGKYFGAFANWITKFDIFTYQIENEIEYLCLLEDDVLVNDEFEDFLYDKIKMFGKVDYPSLLRLGKFGEGYFLDLRVARHIINILRQDGVVNNIDLQLRHYSRAREIRLDETPWELKDPPYSKESNCHNFELSKNQERELQLLHRKKIVKVGKSNQDTKIIKLDERISFIGNTPIPRPISSQQYHFGESIKNSLNDLVKVSNNYKFKVHIRDDELIVRRIDKKEGWDFDMYLRVLNKPLHGDYEG